MKVKLIQEFKEFAIKGNMIDIAIGVIIGGAFNKVVDALVKQVFLPPLAYLTDSVNYSNKKLVLREAVAGEGTAKVEEIAVGYGQLIEAGIDFLIISLTVFMVVKLMNRLRKKAEDPKDKTESTPKDIELLNQLTEQMDRQIELLEGLNAKR